MKTKRFIGLEHTDGGTDVNTFKAAGKPVKGLGRAAWGLVMLLVCVGGVRGDYSLSGSTFGGGGGTAKAGSYAVSAIAGQPFAGVFSGGGYLVVTGAPSLIAVVQTPGAPVLALTLIGGDVVVSWPLPAAGYAMEETLQMSPAPLWNAVPYSYETNATHVQVTVPADGKMRMFRLHKP